VISCFAPVKLTHWSVHPSVRW